MIYEIPLDKGPQVFTATLAGVAYQITVVWREVTEGGWFIDFADVDGNPIVSGIPLVAGADLLAQHAYLGIGGSLYIQSSDDVDASPTYDSLGDTSHLFFVPSP